MSVPVVGPYMVKSHVSSLRPQMSLAEAGGHFTVKCNIQGAPCTLRSHVQGTGDPYTFMSSASWIMVTLGLPSSSPCKQTDRHELCMYMWGCLIRQKIFPNTRCLDETQYFPMILMVINEIWVNLVNLIYLKNNQRSSHR